MLNDLIKRESAIAALDDEITITGTTNAIVVKDYVQRVKRKLEQLPSAQPEPLTDKEQRIFLAAMEKERRQSEQRTN